MGIKKIIIIAAIAAVVLLLLVLKCGRGKEPEAAKQKQTPVETAVLIPEETELPPIPAEEEKKVKKEKSLAPGFEFKKEKGESGRDVLRIFKDDEEVLKKEAGEKESIVFGKKEGGILPEAGRDLNGNSIPDVVIQLNSAKDSCSNIYTIYELRGQPEMAAEIKGLAQDITFKDMEDDGVPELIGHDCTFLDWWASIGETPAPKVILRWVGGQYVLDEFHMRKNPPSKEEMKEYLDENKGRFVSYVWKYMLDLIYTGNGDIAWEFYDMVEWDESWEENIMNERSARGVGSKEDFLGAFKEQLSTSPYWGGIKSLNNWEMLDVEM